MIKFSKLKIMLNTIIRFISSRVNLTILQCMLYFMVGYVMGQYLNWLQLIFMYIILFGIQFITRTKAVADGMMFRQMMIDNEVQANEFLRIMKEESDKINRGDMN